MIKRIFIILVFLALIIGSLASIFMAKFFLHRIKSIHVLRTDAEVYRAQFNKYDSKTVHLIRVQDAVLPIVDADIELLFSCDVNESKRLLQLESYQREKVSMRQFTASQNDFIRTSSWLGDSIYRFSLLDTNSSSGVELWMSLDSSLIYYRRWW